MAYYQLLARELGTKKVETEVIPSDGPQPVEKSQLTNGQRDLVKKSHFLSLEITAAHRQ